MSKKATCKNHKRFVPTCDPCKSEALKETVGFPGVSVTPENADTMADTPDPSPDQATVNDIPDYEADEEEPLTPAEEPVEEIVLSRYAEDIDKTEADGESDPEPVVMVEIDGEGNVVSTTSGEGESDYSPEEDAEADKRATHMSPIEMAMFMFPQRLISQNVAPFVEKTLASYLELGLTPEDAVIVTAGEVIHAEQLDGLTPEVEEEVEEAFEAGIEIAPEITGCIEDYNQGFNEGMSALHRLMIDHYAGDEDAVAYEMMRWLERKMAGMKK